MQQNTKKKYYKGEKILLKEEGVGKTEILLIRKLNYWQETVA